MQRVNLLYEVASIVPRTGVDLDLVHVSSNGTLDVSRMHNSNSSLARSWCACEASVVNKIVDNKIPATQEDLWMDQGDCLLGQIMTDVMFTIIAHNATYFGQHRFM